VSPAYRPVRFYHVVNIGVTFGQPKAHATDRRLHVHKDEHVIGEALQIALKLFGLLFSGNNPLEEE
jgi:hypothetical protein